jgi:lambda family phage portal protein
VGKKRKRKSATVANLKKARRYDGAMSNRLTTDWLTSSGSADTDLYTSLRSLRNRARDLVRNNPYLKQAVCRTIPNNVVGTGIRFQSQIKKKRSDALDERLNTEIERAWEEWQDKRFCHTAGKLCFPEIESLLVKSLVESGEVLIRIVNRSFDGSPIPLALEIIESDQLCDTHALGSYGDNLVKMGVELDEWQRPVAYHLYPYHPGDSQFSGRAVGARLLRVPASEIIHLFVSDRPGQTRGVPWLHATIGRMRQIGELEEAEIVAARISAAVAAFIESADPTTLAPEDAETNERFYDLEPGMIQYLAPGEKFNGFAPTRPNPALDGFLKLMLRSSGTSIGVSYEGFTGDYSDTSYSSARTSKIQEQDGYKILQARLVRDFLAPLYRVWLDMAVLSGRVKIDDYFSNSAFYCKPKFIPRGWSYVNPKDEITANMEAVKAGFATLTDIASESGKDFEEMLKTRQRELNLLKQYGITLDTGGGMAEESVIVSEKQWRQKNLIEQYKKRL